MISNTFNFFKHLKIARFAGGPCIFIYLYYGKSEINMNITAVKNSNKKNHCDLMVKLSPPRHDGVRVKTVQLYVLLTLALETELKPCFTRTAYPWLREGSYVIPWFSRYSVKLLFVTKQLLSRDHSCVIRCDAPPALRSTLAHHADLWVSPARFLSMLYISFNDISVENLNWFCEKASCSEPAASRKLIKGGTRHEPRCEAAQASTASLK